VSQTSSYMAPILPIILCAPKFLDGSMSLGQVMQAAWAFTIVQGAFNWLVDNYPRLSDWTASARRVASLEVSLDALENAETRGIGRIKRGEGAALRLRNLSVTLDDGTAVVNDAQVEIMPGEKVLVAGESGTGKSTLVRAIAGLWPWGEGDIEVQRDANLFLLPQRPYVPIGTCGAPQTTRRRPRAGAWKRSRKPLRKSGSATSPSALRTRVPGIRPCQAGRNSVWPLRESFCTAPTSSCSMRRRPPLIQGARID